MKKRETVLVAYGFDGLRVSVKAEVFGPFAIHHSICGRIGSKARTDSKYWTLTHLPTGRAAALFLVSRETALRTLRSLSCAPFSYRFWQGIARSEDLKKRRLKRLGRMAAERVRRASRESEVRRAE